ncbi:MAG TPA: NADH-quinone oxidoreductase subunit C [Alkalispirochaeta sp.]|nr:NADH-quinone oxidoreductase subunit C [Alkalispirochaeta sp.]
MSDQQSTNKSAEPAVHKVFADLHNRYAVRGLEEIRPDLAFLRAGRDEAVAILTHARSIHGYRHLAFFTAIDQIEEERFELLYMLHSYELKHDLGVIVEIPREGEACAMDTIHHLWPAAETYQRELREMFGIDFPESPGLQDDFALEGWEDIPPMRKEFDTREYSERVYYTRPGRAKTDNRGYMKEKIYPSEAETW